MDNNQVINNTQAGAPEEAPKVLKESKNKITVDFERTSKKERLKIKYLNVTYVATLIWRIFRFLLLLGVSYVILYPFFSKIATSFMTLEDFADVTVKLIPKYPTLDTYKAIITDLHYFRALLATFLVSLFSAVIQMFICCLIGYGFAKFKFKGSKILFALVIFTMIVPHSTIQLAMFVKFKNFDIYGILKLIGGGSIKISLTGTLWPLVILSLGGLAFKNGLYIFMMRQFFRGVPDELEESAYIDGSGVFRTFFTIVLPLSIPMMITIFLFAFSWQWTDTFYTDLFSVRLKIGQQDLDLLPKLVGKQVKSLDTKSISAAAGLFSSAIQNTIGLMIITPLIIVYLFCQRYLVEGIERSGIVG